MRNPCTETREKPSQQQRPSTAPNKKKNKQNKSRILSLPRRTTEVLRELMNSEPQQEVGTPHSKR